MKKLNQFWHPTYIYQTMGNKTAQISTFQESNWKEINKDHDKSILFHDLTKKTLEKHQYFTTSQQTEIRDVLEWRSDLPTQSCVTQLYEYGIKKGGLCTPGFSVFVIVERLSKFSEIRSISLPQSFLMIKDLIFALKHISTKFGLFLPDASMIGVNLQGRAKLWINANSAVCSLEQGLGFGKASQIGILNNIVRLISPKVYKDSNYPINFPSNLNFSSALTYIDKSFQEVKGFRVDKIYLDREEFKKNYYKLRQTERQEEKSRLMMAEATRRIRQIQAMHLNLKKEQQKLMEKQEFIKQQSHKYDKPPYLVHGMPNNAPFVDNRFDQDSEQSHSWKRRLVRTVSTNNNQRQEQMSTITFERRNPFQENLQKPTSIKPDKSPELYNINIHHANSAIGLRNEEPKKKLSPKPPLPPKKRQISEQGRPNTNRSQKPIEMVQSMIIDRQDNTNLQYVESQLIQYQT